MLIQLVFAHTAHFALNVFASFTFFAAGLLFLDSWHVDTVKKTPLLRSIGFFLLALAAATHATTVEIPLIVLTANLVKIFGLVLILASLIREPLLRPPHKKKLALFIPLVIPVASASLTPLSTVLMILIAATYFRKATEGMEQQVKPVYFAFLFLGLSEALRIPFFWSNSSVVFWSKMLGEYGSLWGIQHIFELVGVCILGVWAWGYIRFRLQVQLFVSTVALSLILFSSTTTVYTFLLLRSLEQDALAHLKTDVRVLQYALESVKGRTLSYAQAVAQDPNITQAVITHNKTALFNLSTDYMIAQKITTLVIASPSGEVLMRAEDKDRTNDTIKADALAQSAFGGNEVVTVTYDEGITVPVVAVKAAVPIRGASDNSIGIVVTGVSIDSAFVDGVKAVTGLDTAVFGGNKRAATTFVAPDGKSRFVGTLETNTKVLDTVLSRGEVYVGPAHILNLPFYAAYAPLKTHENKVVGMLFVGKLQNTLTDAAKKSISLTFLGSVILIVLSLIPAYLFSRFLKEHLEV